jgi:hypothetical protein
MTLVKEYEISRLAIIFLVLRDSYASCAPHKSELPILTPTLNTYENKRKQNARAEKDLCRVEWDKNATVGLFLWARVEDIIGPFVAGQHGHSGEDIGDVYEE